MKVGIRRGPPAGQGMVELVAATGLVFAVVVAGLSLLNGAWIRFQCARLAYGRAHAALLGEESRSSGGDRRRSWQLHETAAEVLVVARCGPTGERVAFGKLEAEP